MLEFKNIEHCFFDSENGLVLFKRNPVVRLTILAPIYWWVDIDWPKYYLHLPLSDFEFCLDSFETDSVPSAVAGLSEKLSLINDQERKVMQLLPLSTLVTATIELSYQEVVEVCENYVAGEYRYIKGYGFPNESEWNDFCTELLKIPGIKDLIKEE